MVAYEFWEAIAAGAWYLYGLRSCAKRLFVDGFMREWCVIFFFEARTNAEFSEVVKSQQGDAGNV